MDDVQSVSPAGFGGGWGPEAALIFDFDPDVVAGAEFRADGELAARQSGVAVQGGVRGYLAAYVAKYATKAAECTGTLDQRINPATRLADLPVREHPRRLIAECLRLGKLPELEQLRLAAWAHMLGFRGHFSTKSRAYSTTLGALRAARAQHQREHAIATGLLPRPAADTTLVLAHWHFAGRGHPPISPLSAAATRPPSLLEPPTER